MKNVLLTLIMAFAFVTGYSQMDVEGNVVVESGANLVVEGALTVGTGGDIENDGVTTLKGNVTVSGGTVNTGSTGTWSFEGSADQTIGGTSNPIFNGTVNLNSGNNLNLTTDVTFENLTFTSGDVKPGTNNLTVTGAISGASATNYVVTDNTGTLTYNVGASDVVYHVGNSSYNPITLNNSGTADDFSVRVVDGLPTNFTSDNHAVGRTWEISEGTAGGSDLTVTPQWAVADEQASFDRTDASVGLTADGGSSFTWATAGSASGGDPYTLAGSGFTGVGEFVVADYYHEGIELDVDVFLAGPYSGGSMSTALNTYIPTTDPYGTSTTVSSVPAGAVDWVKVELRNKTDNTDVQHTYAFFVDANGQLLNTDGSVDAKLTGAAKDQYYLAVNHRNHLGAMTSSTVDLSGSSGSFDFTTGTGVFGTNPLRDLGGSTFGLWAGDVNADGEIVYQGSGNDPTPIGNEVSGDPGNTSNSFTYVVNGYSDNDVNLDGNVIYQGSSNDPTLIGNAVSNHPGNVSSSFTYRIQEQLP